MAVYLLDTCVWASWFDPKKKGHDAITKRVDDLTLDDTLYISIITWGEIEYGHRAESPDSDSPVQTSYIDFIEAKNPSYTLSIFTLQRLMENLEPTFSKNAPLR